MKTKITITYDTDNIEDSDDILTQIGLLLMKNSNKTKEYEIEHEQDV
ncbi:TPA: hypothetical protein LA460_000301 [Clostridium botulinum]|nr:hypothetical protein [Clostridium botulinum]HBJ1652905.1 hypothetical protein [Clostridium botulinum]